MQFNRIKYDYTTSKIKSNRVKINYLKLLLALCILALTLCAGWPDEAKCDEKVLIFVLCILEMICLSIHNKTKYFVLLISRFVGKKNFRFWTFCNLFSEKKLSKNLSKNQESWSAWNWHNLPTFKFDDWANFLKISETTKLPFIQ